MAHSKATMDAIHRTVEALKEWDISHSTMMAYSDMAGAVLEALSTPEFVLPLAEEMLRKAGTHEVSFYGGSLSLGAGSVSLRDGRGVCMSNDESLIEAYRALLGET